MEKLPIKWNQSEDERYQEDGPVNKRSLILREELDPILQDDLRYTSRSGKFQSAIADFLGLTLAFVGFALLYRLFPEIFNFTMLAFAIGLVLSFFLPVISNVHYLLQVRWLGIQWRISYAVKIHAGTSFNSVASVLENMAYLRLYQLNIIEEKSTILVFTGTRWFFPLDITPTKFIKMIDAILHGEKIIFSPTPTPNIHLPHFHFLTSRKLYYKQDKLIQKLQENDLQGQVLTMTRFHHRRVNSLEGSIDTYYAVYIGFNGKDLDRWVGLINTISSGVRHQLYSWYLLNRYFPALWGFLTQFYLPVIGKIIEGRANNLVFSRKMEHIMRFPRYDRLSKEIFEYTPPSFDNSYRYRLGELISHGFPIQDFGIPIKDLAQGGIIAGAIGSGKTTLRLHLLRLVRAHGLRVVDFDLKGDATRYSKLIKDGKVVIPGRNFHLNPFLCPNGFTHREYANILYQSFVETIPNGSELSPPQLHLMTRGIAKTVKEGGNAHQFFKNLYILAAEEQQFVDNKQDSTAQAIITRFNWMQTVMHDIFWYDTSSLPISDFASTSLYFDLSELDMTVTKTQIRFLINLVMARIMASMRNRKESKLRDVIFLDETQLLMPRKSDNKELSKLEQTVTTLRYKGVSVIATGVSAALMSPVLLDVGFVAQFRSESDSLYRALALNKEEEAIIPQLPLYHTMIRSGSVGSKSVMVKTREFMGQLVIPKLSNTKYQALDPFKTDNSGIQELETSKNTSSIKKSIPLADFDLDFTTIWSSRFESTIFDDLDVNPHILKQLRLIASNYVDKHGQIYEIKPSEIKNTLNQWFSDTLQQVSTKEMDPIIEKHQIIYLHCLLYQYLINFAHQIRYESLMNLLKKNYQSIIHEIKLYMQDLVSTTADMEYKEEKNDNIVITESTELKLQELKHDLDRLQEMQSVEISYFNTLILKIAGLLEEFGRRKASTSGLGEVIKILDDEKWITGPQEHNLQQFRRIRNRVVHGTYNHHHVERDLVTIYTSGRVTVKIWGNYRSKIEEVESKFHIHENDDFDENKV